MSYEPPRFDFSIPVRVNLSSDTQTKPSPAMKQAMMEAEVGDEQGGSDPTVWELCDRTAALLGKEAAIFLPSGTMCNQVAIATHCRRATRCWRTRTRISSAARRAARWRLLASRYVG
jgi:threonine aldolase